MARFVTIPICPISNPDASYIAANGVYLHTINWNATPFYAMMNHNSEYTGVYFRVGGERYIGFNALDDSVIILGYTMGDDGYNETVNLSNGYCLVRRFTSGYGYISDAVDNPYSTLVEACTDIPLRVIGASHPIIYHLTNCTAPDAPQSADSGDTVSVSLQFPSGYAVVNNNQAYVMNNGVIIPSTYSNGTLTFTMP